MDNPDRFDTRRRLERLDRLELETFQVQKFNDLLRSILRDNAFYREKFAGLSTSIARLADLRQFPFTTKRELIPQADSASIYSRNLTFPISQYQRLHRTSGTLGHPLLLLDTAEDWKWWIESWQYVLDTADITADDRALMAFSFGPFIGFWSANDALLERGAMIIPGGGLSTVARLELLLATQATIICCTPSYALHLAEVAAERNYPIRESSVRALIVAGEHGGSLAPIANRIRQAWGADVIDHAGATEVGPWGYSDRHRTGLHIIESEFIAEFLRLEDQQPAEDGELAELVLTSLGRLGAPLVRYRTGDLVRAQRNKALENRFVHLAGGVLGRVDNMVIIRGVNVFPAAIEQVLHEFPDIHEYRIHASRRGAMDHLRIELETTMASVDRIAETLQARLGLQIEVDSVPLGSLPRSEHKGQRFVDHRK